MKKTFTIFFLSLTLLSFFGCAGSTNRCEEKQLLKYSIILGSGGGFTGAYEGKMIDTLGNIYNWEGRTFITANKKVVDSLSQSQISKLNDFLNENSFENYSFKEVGNMTTFLTLSSSIEDKTFSWKESAIPDRVPAKIKEIYFLIINMLDSKK